MMQWFENFEMAQSGEVEREEIIALVERDASEIRGIAAKVLCEIVQHATGSADGCRAVLQTKAVERGNLEMVANSEESSFRSEDPIIVTVDDPAVVCFGWPLSPNSLAIGL